MLQFFRKYERSFLLIVFAPTIIGLGLTGTIAAVIGGQGGDDTKFPIFEDETISHSELIIWKGLLENLGRAMGGYRQIEDEEAFDFLAKLRSANNAGIVVTDEELAEQIKKLWEQRLAFEEAQKELAGLPEEVRNRRLLEFFTNAQKNVSLENPKYHKIYRERLTEAGFSVSTFENAFRDMLRVEKLEKYIRESARVTAEQIREEFDEQHHRRRVEFLALSAADHLPSEADATTEALKKFYDDNPRFFQRPRSAAIEYMAVELEGLEDNVDPPSEEKIKAYYEKNIVLYRDDPDKFPPGAAAGITTGGVAGATSAKLGPPPPPRPFEEVAEGIKNLLWRKKIESEFDAIRTRIGALARIRAANFEKIAKDNGVRYGKTDQISERATVLLEGGFGSTAAKVSEWFAAAVPDVASGSLMDEGGPAIVARLVDVVPPSVPDLDEIGDEVREAYLHGAKNELQDYYDRNTSKFQREARYTVRYVLFPYEKFTRLVDAPDEERLKSYYEKYPSDFRAQDGSTRPFDDVKAEVEEKVRLQDSKNKVQDVCDELIAKAKAERRKKGSVELYAGVLATDEGLKDYFNLAVDGKVDEATLDVIGDHEHLGAYGFLQDVKAIQPSYPAGKSYETPEREGRFVALVEGAEAAKTLSFDEARDEVKDAVMRDRGLARARERADAIHEKLSAGATREEAFGELALTVSPFFGRDDEEVEGFADFKTLRLSLFDLDDEGEWGEAFSDPEEGVVYLARVEAKEPPPDDTLVERFDTIRRTLLGKTATEKLQDWRLHTSLAARGLTEDIQKEAWALTRGAADRKAVRYLQIWCKPDPEIVKKASEERALEIALEIERRLRKGAPFEELADKYSNDDGSAMRGGELGWFGRNVMVPEFEEAAFSADVGRPTKPVKTQFGYHLIEVLERGTGERGGQLRARHILVSSDPEKRKLKKQTEDLAWAKAKKKAADALARLEAGESFRKVARELSDEDGALSTGGAPFEPMPWPSKHEVAILSLTDFGVSEIVTDEAGASIYWVREHRNQAPSFGRFRQAPKPDRAADRAFFAGAEGVEKAERFKAELLERCEARKAEIAGDPSSPVFYQEFRKLVRETSESASKTQAGSIGVIEVPQQRRDFGARWVAELAKLETGQRSGVFKTDAGYHILMVEGFETESYEDGWREAAEKLLAGTTYDRRLDR